MNPQLEGWTIIFFSIVGIISMVVVYSYCEMGK
jgi:hypothetical protein